MNNPSRPLNVATIWYEKPLFSGVDPASMNPPRCASLLSTHIYVGTLSWPASVGPAITAEAIYIFMQSGFWNNLPRRFAESRGLGRQTMHVGDVLMLNGRFYFRRMTDFAPIAEDVSESADWQAAAEAWRFCALREAERLRRTLSGDQLDKKLDEHNSVTTEAHLALWLSIRFALPWRLASQVAQRSRTPSLFASSQQGVIWTGGGEAPALRLRYGPTVEIKETWLDIILGMV